MRLQLSPKAVRRVRGTPIARASVLLLLALSAGVAVVVVGCGGGGQQQPTTGTSSTTDAAVTAERKPDRSAPVHIGLPLSTSSFSKRRYLIKANAICRRSWADALRSFAHYSRQRHPTSTASRGRLFAFMSKYYLLPHMQFWFDDISYLGGPKGDEVRVEDMLEALQKAVYQGEEQPVRSAHQLAGIFSSFNRMARPYGLEECLVEPGRFDFLAR